MMISPLHFILISIGWISLGFILNYKWNQTRNPKNPLSLEEIGSVFVIITLAPIVLLGAIIVKVFIDKW